MTNNNNPLGYCEKCIFWVGEEEETTLQRLGYCYRHPPIPITQADWGELPENLDLLNKEFAQFLMAHTTRSQRLFARPVTESSEFCGEWQERKG